MWDNHRLLNRIASLMIAASMIAVAYTVVMVVIRLPVFNLRSVQIEGPLGHTTREQVDAIANQALRGTFFTVDLEAGRKAFEKLPWVRHAQLRRTWPDRLEVAFEEHVPLARWHDFALVNIYGEVFEAASAAALPVFAGPEGSAAEITRDYETFRQALATIGRAPLEIRLSSRRAWQLKLDDGQLIELGRDDVLARLRRFVTVYPQIAAHLPQSGGHIDLRYPNGFAVRIPGLRWTDRRA
ncbi:MAG TPA: cell division protein FtsQ/DivIB [Burkholderiales bacterium]|nr:cell division protein FtsQ/DivIB [Burkholderiales bacterium]